MRSPRASRACIARRYSSAVIAPPRAATRTRPGSSTAVGGGPPRSATTRAAPANHSVSNVGRGSGKPGSTCSTCAPRPSRRPAARATRAATSGSTVAWPSAGLNATRRPATSSAGSRNGAAGGSSAVQSRRSGSVRTSSSSATSRTERAMGPTWARTPNGLAGHAGTRPYVGLMPGSPQKPHGIRIEPAAVGAQRERDHARRQRGGAAAAGATRRPRHVPGVARDAVQRSMRHALPAELGRRRLPHGDGAVARERRDGRCVDVPALPRIDRARAAQGGPAACQQDVLDRHRDPVEQAGGLAAHPALLRPRGSLPRAIGVDEAERVDRRVLPRDALQRRVELLQRRARPCAEGLDERGGVLHGGHPGKPRCTTEVADDIPRAARSNRA